MTAPVDAEWSIREEFAQRLGCGVIAAVLLPLWFAVLFLAVESTLAIAASGVLLVLTVLLAALALRRARRIPRLVRIEDCGKTLCTVSRSGVVSRPLAELRRVDIGTSLGVWPMVLSFADGSRVRLPKELDDLPDFLDALRRRCPKVVVNDRAPEEGLST